MSSPRSWTPTRASARDGVTRVLMAVTVVAFLLQTAAPALTRRFGLLPAAVADGQVERLLTAAFLHAGVLHLASNMLGLWLLGRPLEAALGRQRFVGLYLASAVGGSLVAVALSPPYVLGVGASGAVFGLFGAAYALRRRLGLDPQPLLVLLGINLVLSFAVPGISWQAHLGGLATGAVLARLLIRRR